MMSRRTVKAVAIVIGVVALVVGACSQQPDAKAPTSTVDRGSNVTVPMSIGEATGPTVSSQPRVSILDTINPEECSFAHNINACFTDGQPPARIPLGESTKLFMMARDDLNERFGISPVSVKIMNLTKVEWGDASLGDPEPEMMYSQVITPGFKMSLAAEGSTYSYHTSMDRVVFVERPLGADIRGLVIVVERIVAQNSGRRDFDRTIGFILVEGAIEDDTTYDKARISVTDKTRIFQQERGERHVATFASLNIGKALAKVEVQFIGSVAESYPVQATAAEIVIMSQSSGSVPPVQDVDITERDNAEIVKLSLKWALVDKKIPDYGLYFSEIENIIISVENIEAGVLPRVPGVNLTLLHPEEIQRKADEEGDFLYLRFSQLEVSNSEAKVSLDSIWAAGKDSQEMHHAGYAYCNAEYHRESGEWIINEPLCMVP